MGDTIFLRSNEDMYESLFDIDIVIEQALSKVLYVNFDSYGFKTIESYPDEPCDLSTITTTGNFSVENYSDAPDDLIAIYPLRISVMNYDGKIIQCIHHMLDIYYRYATITENADGEKEVGTFGEWKTTVNNGTKITCGSTEPASPSATDVWIDTSISKYPVIKIYVTTDGWTGIGSIVDTLNETIYDEEGKKEDIFLYFEKKFGLPGADASADTYVNFFNLRAKFLSHMVKLGHVSEGEAKILRSLVSIPEVEQRVEDAVDTILAYLAQKVEDMDIDGLREKLESGDTLFNAHYTSTHVTNDLKILWNGKSEADHSHIFDDKVTISANDIVDGTLSMELMPDEAIHILKRVQTHAQRFALTKDQVQNGDSVYVSEETDEYESGLYLVYNDLKLNSDEGYIYYRSRRLANIDYEDIDRRPTTLEGYGITDGSLVKLNSETYEFLYPYNTIDNTVNYALTKAILEFKEDLTDILDTIEAQLNSTGIDGLVSLVSKNLEKYTEIKPQWDPYRKINDLSIVAQHEANNTLYDATEAIYESAQSILIGE